MNTSSSSSSGGGGGGIDEDKELWNDISELESGLESSLLGNITQDDLDALKAVQGFATGIGKWTGLDQADWVQIKEKMIQSMLDAQQQVDNDPYYFERIDLLKKVYPESAMVVDDILSEALLINVSNTLNVKNGRSVVVVAADVYGVDEKGGETHVAALSGSMMVVDA